MESESLLLTGGLILAWLGLAWLGTTRERSRRNSHNKLGLASISYLVCFLEFFLVSIYLF